MKSFSARVLAVIAILSIIVNVLLYFRYSTSRPVVTVGNTVITKKQFLDQLEHDAGQPVLSKLVFSAIVAQAAAKAGVLPTDQDVEDRVQTIRRQAPQVLIPYNQDSVKMAQFRQDLTTNMALENLRIQDVALTPTQIAEYYESHKKDFALPQQILTTTVVTQNAIDAETAIDLLHENDPPDVIGRQPRLHVIGIGGYNPDMQTLPLALKQQISAFVQSSKVGDVKTFHTSGFFLTFRITGNNHEVIPPLPQVRGQVERAARLEFAPSQQAELAKLYHEANPTFSVDKYAGYFADVQQYTVGTDNEKKTALAH
ncbi:MAG: hypothetical protein ACRYFS_07180 [Janthinobacterium lividum]